MRRGCLLLHHVCGARMRYDSSSGSLCLLLQKTNPTTPRASYNHQSAEPSTKETVYAVARRRRQLFHKQCSPSHKAATNFRNSELTKVRVWKRGWARLGSLKARLRRGAGSGSRLDFWHFLGGDDDEVSGVTCYKSIHGRHLRINTEYTRAIWWFATYT